MHRGSPAEYVASELASRSQVQFREEIAQVVLDGLRADHQPFGHLAVAHSLRHQTGDGQLLRSQRVALVVGAADRTQTGAGQLPVAAIDEGGCSQVREPLTSGLEL